MPVVLCFCSSILEASISRDSLKHIIERANDFNERSMVKPSLEYWLKVWSIAEENSWEYESINARISIGELYRKQGDYKGATQFLLPIKRDTLYPDLMVRRCSRLASVYHEWSELKGLHPQKKESYVDSVEHYLNIAIPLAYKYQLFGYMANLKCDLALHKLRNTNECDSIQMLLEEAGTLFLMENDSHNYFGSVSSLIATMYQCGEAQKADSLVDLTLTHLDKTPWIDVRSTIIQNKLNHVKVENDSGNINYWLKMLEEAQAELKYYSEGLIAIESEGSNSNQIEFDQKIEITESEQTSNWQFEFKLTYLVVGLALIILFFRWYKVQ
jgi:hypothetical protein